MAIKRPQRAPLRRSLLTVFAVALLTAWGLVNASGKDSVRFFPPGGFGIPTDPSTMRVLLVIPGMPGDKAGIVVGDRIDESPTPFAERRLSGQLPAPGTRETIRVVHGTRSRTVTLTAVQMPAAFFADYQTTLPQALVNIIIVLLGAFLVLMRPGPMTWAFFIYCVGLNPSTTTDNLHWMYYIPHWLWYGFGLLSLVLDAAGWTAFLIFALLFPGNQNNDRISRSAQRWSLSYFAIFLTAMLFGGLDPAGLASRFGFAIVILTYIAAMAIFLSNYRRAHSEARQRIRWVLIGLAIALSVRVTIDVFGFILDSDPPPWLNYLLIFLPVAMPVSVVYAIARYRVFDIGFVVSRALAIAVIGAIILALFGLVDFLFHIQIARTRLGFFAEAVVAISLSLGLHSVRHWMIGVSERILFRGRHLATQRLSEIAQAMPHAEGEADVARLLINEPCDALQLQSGALYRPEGDGSYRLEASAGPLCAATGQLTANDPLLKAAAVHASNAAIRISAWVGKSATTTETDSGDPIVALPITIRHRLAALALYGSQQSGADFDPDQLRSISALAIGASAAYDHIEALKLRKDAELTEELRRQNEALRKENEALKADKPSL